MRWSRGVLRWLPWLLLTACVAPQTEAPMAGRAVAPTPELEYPAPDRLLTRGDIQIAKTRLKDFGFDPGPVDGLFTAQTQAAVRAFQVRYGLPVSGLLDRATREELQLGVDLRRTANHDWGLCCVLGGTMLNVGLVRLGYAQVRTFRPNVRYQERFLALQRQAREAKRGLWG